MRLIAQVVEWNFAECWFIENFGTADPEYGTEASEELGTMAWPASADVLSAAPSSLAIWSGSRNGPIWMIAHSV